MSRIDLLKRVMDNLSLTEVEAQVFLEQLTPVLHLDDLLDTPREPGIWRYSHWYSLIAVAAQYAAISLRMAANTGTIAVVEKIILNATNDVVYWGEGTSTTYTDRSQGYQTDLSNRERYYSAATVASEQGAGPYLTASGQIFVPTTGVILEHPFRVSPGRILTLRTSGVNQALWCCFIWREMEYRLA